MREHLASNLYVALRRAGTAGVADLAGAVFRDGARPADAASVAEAVRQDLCRTLQAQGRTVVPHEGGWRLGVYAPAPLPRLPRPPRPLGRFRGFSDHAAAAVLDSLRREVEARCPPIRLPNFLPVMRAARADAEAGR